MTLRLSRQTLLLTAAGAALFCASGCVSKEEREMRQKWETADQRANREVFRSDWVIPSVSEDDKDFFYRSWLRSE